MANISITIPDARLVESLNAAAYALGYSSTIEASPGNFLPNPENKTQFVRRKIAEHVKGLIERGAREKAAYEAGVAAYDSVKDIAIT